MIHKGSFVIDPYGDDCFCIGECVFAESRIFPDLAAALADGLWFECPECGRRVDDDAMRFGASDDLDDDRPMDPCCAVTKDGSLRYVFCSTACHDACEAGHANHP